MNMVFAGLKNMVIIIAVLWKGRPGSAIPASIMLCLLLLEVSVHSAVAQNYLTSTGQPSFTTPEPVELGFVDASNGNLHLSIPLGTYPQRANGQPETISLEYDSNIWGGYVYGSPSWEPYNAPGPNTYAGWYFSFQAGAQNSDYLVPVQGCWEDWPWTDQ